MKKQNRTRNLGKQRKQFRRNSLLELLEQKNLLAGDLFVIGRGTPESINEVDAEIRINETETSDDTIDVRVTNNTFGTAELIPLGFDPGEFAAIDLRGELIEPVSFGGQLNIECNGDGCPEQLDALGNQIPPVEDGSINDADTVNWQGGSPIVYTGAIGDSPNHGNSDADFYEFLDVPAGRIITAHVEMGAGENFSGAALVLYDGFGDILRTSDAINLFGNDNDSFITFITPEAGDYYVAVAAIDEFGGVPFEPPSPFRNGRVQLQTEATPYTLTLGVNASDIDFYAVDLNPGDVLGVNAIGAANVLSVYRPDETFQYMSGADRLSPPLTSPLPRGGSASAAYVADEAGVHYVAVEGFEFSRYLLEVAVIPTFVRIGSGRRATSSLPRL